MDAEEEEGDGYSGILGKERRWISIGGLQMPLASAVRTFGVVIGGRGERCDESFWVLSTDSDGRTMCRWCEVESRGGKEEVKGSLMRVCGRRLPQRAVEVDSACWARPRTALSIKD